MEDLTEKKCQCGDTMGEVIDYEYQVLDQQHVPHRAGWYCASCRAWEKAIGRERVIAE